MAPPSNTITKGIRASMYKFGRNTLSPQHLSIHGCCLVVLVIKLRSDSQARVIIFFFFTKFLLLIYLFIWLLGLSCGTWALGHVGCYSVACEILVPQPGVEPMSPMLTPGPLRAVSSSFGLNFTPSSKWIRGSILLLFLT